MLDPEEQIIAVFSEHAIPACAAVENVIARAAQDGVIPPASIEEIGVVAAIEKIGGCAAGDGVVTRAADHEGRELSGDGDPVVARAAFDAGEMNARRLKSLRGGVDGDEDFASSDGDDNVVGDGGSASASTAAGIVPAGSGGCASRPDDLN